MQYLWILLTALAFGTMEIALKIGGGSFSPFQLTFLRFLVGGLFLLPFAVHHIKKNHIRITPKDFAFLSLLGTVMVVCSMTLFQASVMHANANMAAVLISINPVFTMLFAHFIIHERFTRKKAIILAVCLSGLCLVANPFHLAQGNEPIGLLMGLGASAAFGLYTALSKRIVGKLGGMTVNACSFLIGAALECLLLLLLNEPIFDGIQRQNIGVLSYICLVVTGFGYFCFMNAIEKTGPSTASYAFFLKPIIAMILAAAILGEAITWNIALGIAIIVAGCSCNVWMPKALKKLPIPRNFHPQGALKK